MKYHIKLNDGFVLASFVNEHDRDVCIDALQAKHPDIPEDYFNAVNEE